MAKKGKKQQQEYSGGAPPIVPAKRITWPKLRRRRELTPRLIRGCDVFTVPGALSAEECEQFIGQAEAVGFQWQGSGGPAKGEAYRDNHRISVEDNDLAAHLWTRLAPVLHPLQAGNRTAVRLNPNIRIYRYSPGQQFGAHIDESVAVAGGGRTEYTLLAYLSGAPSTWEGEEEAEGVEGEGEEGGEGEGERGGEGGEREGEGAPGEGVREADGGEGQWRREKEVAGGRGKGGGGKNQQQQQQQQLVGGETVFYVGARSQESFEVSPEVGMALLHRHGARCLLHEAREVKTGVKYVLRSDVVFK
ncbi:hypothetical protein CLOM_g487 [Closterium sp. NIES-68]|nr:hypothetical protein CLOM_g487 [Closterium sp. NIES-68]GJP60437.1 hypothetical protein CLOP_g17657 [Closterium sp. NIES-67]GJP69225.1 hypothetical protein CLOP_g172 [Closterium sp. NIES-67]